jgi:ABC-type multidrug transport system fused ATPase/permease subunit
MFMRLDDLDGGRIMYGDIDITTYSLEEWRKMFLTRLNTQTQKQDALGEYPICRSRRYAEDVDAVLRESGLNHVADAFKPRYDKTVGGR